MFPDYLFLMIMVEYCKVPRSLGLDDKNLLLTDNMLNNNVS